MGMSFLYGLAMMPQGYWIKRFIGWNQTLSLSRIK